MTKYTWINGKYPEDITVTQVYGVTFKENKILLIKNDGKYHLIGGRPEKNETFEDTLKREFYEEVNTEIEDIHYLGYFIVEEEETCYSKRQYLFNIVTPVVT